VVRRPVPYNGVCPQNAGSGPRRYPLTPGGRLRMDELQHECGIAAIYHLHSPRASRLAPLAGPEQVSRLMPRMLLDLQNRGQLAAGFTTYGPTRDKLLDTYKQIGTVI